MLWERYAEQSSHMAVIHPKMFQPTILGIYSVHDETDLPMSHVPCDFFGTLSSFTDKIKGGLLFARHRIHPKCPWQRENDVTSTGALASCWRRAANKRDKKNKRQSGKGYIPATPQPVAYPETAQHRSAFAAHIAVIRGRRGGKLIRSKVNETATINRTRKLVLRYRY